MARRGEATRPTGDRVREALLNLIGPVDDAAVLDLYAGSGALGLEALSRGARRCVFVETDREACRVIRQNLEALVITGALVLQRDAASVLRAEQAAERRYELVLLDPPYGSWPTLEPVRHHSCPAPSPTAGSSWWRRTRGQSQRYLSTW